MPVNPQYTMTPIAHIRSPFPEKFGIPRQSGLVEAVTADIIFEPDFRCADALRGLDGFSHIWMIWGFSKSIQEGWSPTVRPPRLGGNQRVGVFATRSPYRPNPLGLSSVRLTGIDWSTADGPVLRVCGADLMDGTPIFDIKPYLPYVDSHPGALEGFSGPVKCHALQVVCTDPCLNQIPEQHRDAVLELLSQDPRPSYQKDPKRVYGVRYADRNIRFRVDGQTLTVCGVEICTGDIPDERL